MNRRGILSSAVFLLMAGLSVAASAPDMISRTRIETEMREPMQRTAPGTIGVGILDLRTGATWFSHGRRRFPMQSVFKVALGAAALAQIDAGRLSIDEAITIRRSDLSSQHSPLATQFVGEYQVFTVRSLLTRAVGESDNTAADVLMRRIGGPKAINAYLRSKGIHGMRIDRYESELQTQFNGLGPFLPEWTSWAVMSAAIEALPIDQRRAAFRAYLTDERDTATPESAVHLIAMLANFKLLSRESTALLLRIMEETTTGPRRLRAALPSGARLAHKTGNSISVEGVNGAANDIGLITLSDGRQLAVAVFLTGSTLPEQERDRVIADVGRILISDYLHQ